MLRIKCQSISAFNYPDLFQAGFEEEFLETKIQKFYPINLCYRIAWSSFVDICTHLPLGKTREKRVCLNPLSVTYSSVEKGLEKMAEVTLRWVQGVQGLMLHSCIID